MPHEQMHDLFVEFSRTGDPALARWLVEANLGLAVSVARRMDRTGGRWLPDLIQEAYLGLMEAVRRFDPHRGVSFSTYATYWIRAYVGKFMRDNARLVRLGRSRADRAAYSRGELPAYEYSLDTAVHEDRPGETVGDRIADGSVTADVLLERAEVAGRSQALIARLDPRERAILNERLLSDEPKPLRRLARRFSVSGERLRQIECRLIGKLRGSLDGQSRPVAA
jgi:RNA polymerase sigma factor (sigma-70 family)